MVGVYDEMYLWISFGNPAGITMNGDITLGPSIASISPKGVNSGYLGPCFRLFASPEFIS